MPKNSYVSGKKKLMNRAKTSRFAHPVCTLWKKKQMCYILQGVIESCTDILTTSYWLHVELAKNI
jgi:hypothetical protein